MLCGVGCGWSFPLILICLIGAGLSNDTPQIQKVGMMTRSGVLIQNENWIFDISRLEQCCPLRLNTKTRCVNARTPEWNQQSLVFAGNVRFPLLCVLTTQKREASLIVDHPSSFQGHFFPFFAHCSKRLEVHTSIWASLLIILNQFLSIIQTLNNSESIWMNLNRYLGQALANSTNSESITINLPSIGQALNESQSILKINMLARRWKS